MDTNVKSDYLIHYGILGQKWGIRRYQNPDGSLTEEGRKRYGVDKNTGLMSNRGTKKYLKDRIKNDYKDREVLKKDVRNKTASNELSTLFDEDTTNDVSITDLKKTMSQMSDDELQKIVQRLNLEQRYKELTKSPNTIEAGYKKSTSLVRDSATTLKTVFDLALVIKKFLSLKKKVTNDD